MYLGFIRTCHIPIGRTKAKNSNLNKNKIKLRVENNVQNVAERITTRRYENFSKNMRFFI